MNLETINKWLDEKYGCSYTRLEELHDFYFEKYTDLQQKNKQLKERIEYLERSNNRREDTILEQRQKISDLEDNWNKLKESIDIKLYNTEYLQKLCGYKIDDEIHMVLDIIKKEMKELEAKKWVNM